MMRLNLPDVTLLMIETREHALACLAMQECLDKVVFGDVLLLSDQPNKIKPLTFSGVTTFRQYVVDDFTDKLGWCRSNWYDAPPLLRTPYVLQIQWDSWVWDPTQWTEKFYDYDFIGSPWWYKDGKNVGNTGFSLMSTRLKRFLNANREKFPCNSVAEDDLLCRGYRLELEKYGFTWAPEELAHKFAFECCRPAKDSRHFGFHGAFNFNEVLSEDALIERTRLMLKSDYITNPNGVIWRAFMQKNKDLVDMLLLESGKSLVEAS
jgi:hypothetical protein